MPYPWYQILNNSGEIMQGDFIPECPIIIPPSNLGDLTEEENNYEDFLTVQTLNTVVLSQSCDLEQNKIDIALVSPIYSLEEYFGQLPEGERIGKPREKRLKLLRQGNIAAHHLLNKDPEKNVNDFQVVDFRHVYGVNLEYLKTHAVQIESRVRLLPPYREHLSQAFARFFMRVGLPNDITGLE